MLSHVLGILQLETTLQIETSRLKLDDSVARNKAVGRGREDSTQDNMMMNAAGEEFLHRCVYTQKLLRTEAFTHTGAFRQRNLYTERLLDTEVFTHRGFYTEKSLYRRVLHAETFRQREVFTQRSFDAQKLLH